MKRLLSPSTNTAGLSAAAAAIYAVVLMIYHVYEHQAAFSVPVAIAGISAAAFLLTRQSVTPIADPKDGNGNPLITAPATAYSQLLSEAVNAGITKLAAAGLVPPQSPPAGRTTP